MKAEALIAALRAAELRPQSYSGRGMRGRYCVGVVLPDSTSWTPYQLGVELALALGEGARYIDALVDDMGHDKIAYFPTVRWPEGAEDKS